MARKTGKAETAKKAKKAKKSKKSKKSKKKAKSRKAIVKQGQERKLEEGLQETFPASDPPAVTDPVRGEKHNGGA